MIECMVKEEGKETPNPENEKRLEKTYPIIFKLQCTTCKDNPLKGYIYLKLENMKSNDLYRERLC